MAPTKAGEFEFNPQSLIAIRNKLNITQVAMAKLLDVPTTTLYRWETGATKPDASTLASFYSIAVENQIKPDFFKRRSQMKEKSRERNRLLVMWDFQNMGVSASEVEAADTWVRNTLVHKFSSTNYHKFKAFSHSDQSQATDILLNLNWKVWEGPNNSDEDLIDQCRSDSFQDPESTIVVLITRDGDFVDLIEELKNRNVRVYILAPETVNEDLVNAVGKKRWILWDENYLTRIQANSVNFSQRKIDPQVTGYSQYDYDDDD